MKRPNKALNIENNKLAKELHGTGFYHKLCYIHRKHGAERVKQILKEGKQHF